MWIYGLKIKCRSGAVVFGLVMILLLSGCSSVPNYLKKEDMLAINKLAVVTELSDPGLAVFDRTGVANTPNPAVNQGGLIGGLVGGAIYSALAVKAVNNSLGGDVGSLASALEGFSIEEVFNDNFTKDFKTGLEWVPPQDVDGLGLSEYPETRTQSGKTIRDYSVLRERLGVDTVLEIKYKYGLAAYKDSPASAVVVAEVSLIRIDEKRLLMTDLISSDIEYRKVDFVDTFAADGAKLFKEEIRSASSALGRQASLIFNYNLPPKERSHWADKE